MRCAVRSQSPKRKRGNSLAYASGSAFVFLFLASSLSAQFPPPVTPNAKPQPGPISALGTEGFRAILAQYGLKPLNSLDAFNQHARHTVLIAFRGSDANGKSYPDLLNDNPRLLKSFVDNGGAALVATDQKTEGGWADSFNVRVFGIQIQAFERNDYQECYLSNPVCP